MDAMPGLIYIAVLSGRTSSSLISQGDKVSAGLTGRSRLPPNKEPFPRGNRTPTAMFRKPTICLGLAIALALAGGCDTPGPNPAASDAPTASPPPERHDGSVPFVHGYAQGFQRAQKEGKPMLVFFTAGWCNFCQQMSAETFTNDQVVTWSDRFVCILVDADDEPDICRQFRVKGYPTVQFLSPQGVPLNRVVGKRAADQLISQMQAALGATASRSPPTVLR